MHLSYFIELTPENEEKKTDIRRYRIVNYLMTQIKRRKKFIEKCNTLYFFVVDIFVSHNYI